MSREGHDINPFLAHDHEEVMSKSLLGVDERSDARYVASLDVGAGRTFGIRLGETGPVAGEDTDHHRRSVVGEPRAGPTGVGHSGIGRSRTVIEQGLAEHSLGVAEIGLGNGQSTGRHLPSIADRQVTGQERTWADEDAGQRSEEPPHRDTGRKRQVGRGVVHVARSTLPGVGPNSSSGPGRIVVLGATGYVGARLVPRLASQGRNVVCVSRSAADIEEWAWGSAVTTIEVDLTDTPIDVFHEGDTIVHLVHSMVGADDFNDVDLTIARGVADAAAAASAARIVYLSGLGEPDGDLSDHLASRHAVGDALRSGSRDRVGAPVPVTELQAALLLGSGSASFEMLRTIAQVSPLLPVPTAVTSTRCQPIAIEDALEDLEWAIDSNVFDRVIHIGGSDVMTYGEIIRTYARVAGLRPRHLIPIPLVPTSISAFVLNLIAPLPQQLVRHLVGSVANDVVVDEAKSMQNFRPERAPKSVSASIAAALEADLDTTSHWSDDVARHEPAALLPTDDEWAGQRLYSDTRVITTDRNASEIFRSISSVGGDRGWLVAPVLWELRGILDRLTPGGVGLHRGRRHPTHLRVGDIVDWWRVEAIIPDELLLLRAEMRAPGAAWLEWRITDSGDERRVRQRAVFAPRGLAGKLYWLALLPFHGYLFPRLLGRLVDAELDAVVDRPDDPPLRDPRELV